ncbi:GMC oxidoreductase [Sphaerimonospora cavernae]|uniref:GMC oxidoreductase n=1 Tax=Sphaerimonospora cavernae TaxID=1740611 RepID=A0ABV6U5D1_9ACTN
MITDEHADVVVVGLGAAGGTIAAALAERGLDVVGLEAGPELVRPGDFTDDELLFAVDRKHFWAEPEVLEFEGAATTATWLKRNLGVGGPFVWSGFAYRFHPSDFRVASTVGVPDGSSVEDWPIDYEEMAPWYEAAEQLVGISGNAGTYPFEPPRRGPFPQRPVRRVAGTTLLDEAARALGWHPYQPPAAILSKARGDRSGCSRCGLCTNYACHRDAKASSSVFALPMGLRTGRLRLSGGTRVTEVVCDPVTGRPRAVRYLRADGTTGEQPASVIVLANNAIYVAKLLLQSGSAHHPHGLGNHSDQVGRHLTFHTGGVAWGVYDEQLHVDSGPAQQVAVDDLNEDRPWRAGAGFRRGGVLHGGMPVSFAGGPLTFARALGGVAPLPAGVPTYGRGLMDFAAYAYTRHQAVYSLGEDLPQADNRVVLDPEVRDSVGSPALRMRYRRHPEDVTQIDHLVAASVRLLEASGAAMIASAPSAIPGGMFAGHAHGTTRMGTDPATSVADDRGLVHGTTNLFVAGAGLFVTGAGLNPMLTIIALALRAVDAIADATR